MIKLFVLLIALFSVQILKADCLACWELRKVKITLTTSDTLTGYVQWNEAWLGIVDNELEWRDKFPESLLYLYRNSPYDYNLIVHTKIFAIKNDSLHEFVATKKEHLVELHHSQIKSITELDKDSKKHAGAGPVLLFTQEEIDKLKTNPFAIHTFNMHVSDVYFLSYNPEVTRQELMQLNEYNYGKLSDKLKRKGVIIVDISYD